MKKILWFFLGLGVFLTVLGFSLNHVIEYLANNNIQYLLDQQDPDRVYDYRFDRIHLDIWAGDLRIDSVWVKPRAKAVDSLKRAGQPKRFLLEGQLNNIRMKGLDVFRLILDKEVSLDSFLVVDPVLRILIDPSVKPDTSGPAFSKDLISEKIGYGSIHYLSLHNAQVLWVNSHNQHTIFYCDSVSLTAQDVYTDSILLKSKQPVEFSEALFKGRNFDLNVFEDSRLTAEGIDFRFSKNQLLLTQVIFRNTENKKEFTREQAYETEWYNMKVDRLEVISQDIAHWGYMDYFRVERVTLYHPEVVVYRDKRLKDPPFQVKPLPGKAIQEIPLPLLVEQIEIKNGTATYEEITEKGKLPGRIYFTHINLEGRNFTNVAAVLHHRPAFTIRGNTLFLNKSRIDMRLNFPILDRKQTFYASGTITKVDATDLNNFVSNMVYAEFKQGYIEKASFEMKGDRDSSHGTMRAQYTDLKIQLLDTASVNRKKEHLEKKLLGFLANAVVRKNNVPGTKHYTEGRINLVRPKNKFVLNYIWNSIKVGLMDIALTPTLSKKMVEKTNEKIKERENQ